MCINLKIIIMDIYIRLMFINFILMLIAKHCKLFDLNFLSLYSSFNFITIIKE